MKGVLVIAQYLSMDAVLIRLLRPKGITMKGVTVTVYQAGMVVVQMVEQKQEDPAGKVATLIVQEEDLGVVQITTL